MKKVIVLIILLVAIIFAVAVLYFSKINLTNRNNGLVLSYIPANAALVASFRNDKATNEILGGYDGFKALIGEKEFKIFTAIADTLLTIPEVKNLTNENNFYFSVHPITESDEQPMLFLTTLTKEISVAGQQQLLTKIKNISAQQIKINDKYVWQITFKSSQAECFLYLEKNVAIAGTSRSLLADCIGDKQKISSDFIKEINAGGQRNENSPFNIYLNHSRLSPLLESFYKNPKANKFPLLVDFSGFSSLNMNFKSDALMFNGISTIDTARSQYINCFLRQKPIQNNIIKSLPQITAAYLVFGVSDYQKFFHDMAGLLAHRGDYDKLKTQIQLIKTETGIDLERDLKTYLANEFALIQMSNQEKIAIIQVKNGEKVDFFLQPVSSAYSEKIRHFNYSGVFYNYFGDALKPFVKPFYTVADNYLILSNSATALQQFETEYKRNNLLVNALNFIEFNKFTANQSNISFYLNARNFRQIASSEFKRGISNGLKGKDGLGKFYSFSWQLSSDGNHFFTNFYSSFNKNTQLADTLIKFIEP